MFLEQGLICYELINVAYFFVRNDVNNVICESKFALNRGQKMKEKSYLINFIDDQATTKKTKEASCAWQKALFGINMETHISCENSNNNERGSDLNLECKCTGH